MHDGETWHLDTCWYTFKEILPHVWTAITENRERRVGLNSVMISMIEGNALLRLLVQHGITTEEEIMAVLL